MGKSQNQRIWFSFLFLLLAVTLVDFKLFQIQILDYHNYKTLAEKQQKVTRKVTPARGEIFFLRKDGSLFAAAINKSFPYLYAVPKIVPKDKIDELSKSLAQILDLEEDLIKERLAKENDPFELLAKKIPEDKIEELKKLDPLGVKIGEEKDRFYPNGNIAAHVLGFLGFDKEKRVGRYGIEETFEEKLKGKEGIISGEREAKGKFVFLQNIANLAPKKGEDIVLTIDPEIQFLIEGSLEALMQKWQGEGGSIIVMDPKTGKIMAMASRPSFDPNKYSEEKKMEVFLNPAIQKIFEPGSVVKPLTMSAGIDSGALTPESTYLNEDVIKIGGYTISNSVEQGRKTLIMSDVIEKSLNVGAVFVQRSTGKEKFLEYIKAFGLDEKTDVDLEGEEDGDISNLKHMRDIDYATASFGQGIAVTPIQLLAAISVIANGGNLVTPYIVEKIGDRQIKTTPQIKRRVVKEETTREVIKMMANAVDKGYSKRAKIPGFFVAGKTGTAQVPNPESRGYSEKTIHAFVGFAPAFDPKFAILIKIDNPKGIRFAEGSVAPAFKEMAESLLNYFAVPPERELEK